MARILYVTQWFDPEPNIIKGPRFVGALQEAGHQVDVLTGFPNYPTGRIYPGYRLRIFQREELEGVSVMRVPLYPSHDRSSLGRSLNFLSFFFSVLAFLLLRGRRYDLWYVYHPPILPGLAGAVIPGPLRRPFILEIQDLWPDTVVVSGMRGSRRLGRWLSVLCDFTYARARMIICQSVGIADRLRARGVPEGKTKVVRNWADASALNLPPPDRDAIGMSPAFTLVYGGNIGRMQALDTALDAMALLARRKHPARLVLVGDGIDREPLEARARSLGLDNVRFVSRVPQSEIGCWIAAADALLLHIARDPLFTITVPSKTQYYLASGRPIIAGIEGEAGALLEESGAAVVVPPEDSGALARAIEKMAAMASDRRVRMGLAGRAHYLENLSFQRGMDKTLELIEAAL